MPKLTAEMITDEQIVALHNEALRDGKFDVARTCADALDRGIAKHEPNKRRAARARCAALINARAAGKEQ